MAGPAGPLPVWILVRRTFEDVWENRYAFIATAGLWVILLWVTSVVLFWSRGWAGAAASFLGSVLVLLAHPAVSLAWHRHVILNDGLPAPMAPVNGRVGRYLLWGFLISVLAALPAIVGGLVVSLILGAGLPADFEIEATGTGLEVAISALLLLIGLVVWVKLALVLPAIAIDRRLSLRDSARLMSGSVLRFIAGGVLIAVPLGLVSIVIGLLVAAMGAGGPEAGVVPRTGFVAGLGYAVVELLNQALQFIGTVVYTAYLSFAYLWLIEDGPTEAQGPARE